MARHKTLIKDLQEQARNIIFHSKVGWTIFSHQCGHICYTIQITSVISFQPTTIGSHLWINSLSLPLHQKYKRIIHSYTPYFPSKNYSNPEAVYQSGKQEPNLAYILTHIHNSISVTPST